MSTWVLNPQVLQRNPRITSASLAFVLLCTVLFLVPWHRSMLPTKLLGYSSGSFRGATSLENFVGRGEEYYQQSIRNRQDMIRSYGPIPAKVDPFPPGDRFYVLWDFFPAAFNCPHRIQRLGNLGNGGKWICGVERLALQRPPCIVYSFGITKDSSFEAALLEQAPNCQIWGYETKVDSFGPRVQILSELQAKTHFFPYALGPDNKPYTDPPEFTIDRLMQKNGHKFIDVLKIDVEGGEIKALTSFLLAYVQPDGPTLPVGQLQVEIHARGDEGDFAKFNVWWELLEKAGLRPFWTEANLPYVSHLRTRPDVAEYSFINIKGRHALISNHY